MTRFPNTLKFYISDMSPSPDAEHGPAAQGQSVTRPKSSECIGRTDIELASRSHTAKRAADSQIPREAKRIKPIERKALDLASKPPDSNPEASCSFAATSNDTSNQPPHQERAVGTWDKETLQASIRRVLPSAQPGLFPNDIYDRLLNMPNGFVIEKDSSLRSFRTAIHQALIRMLDLEAITRQSATTEKGGQSHRYIILEAEVRLEDNMMPGPTPHRQTLMPRLSRDPEAQLGIQCSDPSPKNKVSTPRVTEISRPANSMKDQETISQALVHVSHATPQLYQQNSTPQQEQTSGTAAIQPTVVESPQKMSLGTSTDEDLDERTTPEHLESHIHTDVRKCTPRESGEPLQTPHSLCTQGSTGAQSQCGISNKALEPYHRAKVQHLEEVSSGKDSRPIIRRVPNTQSGGHGVSPAWSAKVHTRPAEEAPDVSNKASMPKEKKTPSMQSKDSQSITASRKTEPSRISRDEPQTYSLDQPQTAGTVTTIAGRESSMQKPTVCSTATLNAKTGTIQPNTDPPVRIGLLPQDKVGRVALAREIHPVKEPSGQTPRLQAIDPASKSISEEVPPSSLPLRSSGDVDDPAIRKDNKDDSVSSSRSNTDSHSNLWTPINGAATSSISPTSPQVAVPPGTIKVLDIGANASSEKSVCVSSCATESSTRKSDAKSPDGPKGYRGAIGREVINLIDDTEERILNHGANEDMGSVIALELGKKVGRVRHIKAHREKLRRALEDLQARRRSALTEARNSQVKIDADRIRYHDVQGKLAKLRDQVTEKEKQAAAIQKEAVECKDLMSRKRTECQACATSIRTVEAEFTEIEKELERLLQALDIF